MAAHFSIVIIGGGVGGLTLATFLGQMGHKVTLVEQKENYLEADKLGGLGLGYNSIRCIEHLGLGSGLAEVGDMTEVMSMRRYADGSTLKSSELEERQVFIHRADLLKTLHRGAVDAGVEIVAGESFTSIAETANGVEIHLSGGRLCNADLLVGADGLHSAVRKYCFQTTDNSIAADLTGGSCFLVSVPHASIEKHAATKDLYQILRSNKESQFWLGPGRAIICWNMEARGQIMAHFHDLRQDCGRHYDVGQTSRRLVTRYEDMEILREQWDMFDDAMRILLNEVDHCSRWRIAELPRLPQWGSLTGRTILLGDAAHCLTPYAGQGAGMAIEDAASLATLLSRADSSSDIPAIARTFETLRMPRIDLLRGLVAWNTKQFGLEDGPEQKARDEKLADKSTFLFFPEHDQAPTSASQEGGGKIQQIVNQYDVIQEAKSCHIVR